MSEKEISTPVNVESLPLQRRQFPVTDELNGIMRSIQAACPVAGSVSFNFDGKLHAVIDARKLEDVLLIEMILPTLNGGMFHDIRRVQSPHHSFAHRVSAVVDR